MKKTDRRRFLRELAYLSATLTIGGPGLYYATTIEPFAVEIVEKTIPLPGLKAGLSGLRGVQISDLHMGMWISQAHLEYVVNLILEQKPDLVFITGDSLSIGGDEKQALGAMQAAFSRLTHRVPVFLVMGNHDHGPFPIGKLRSFFAELGIQELLNTVQPFQRNGDALYIAGIDSITNGRPSITRVMERIPPGETVILMAHEPDIADYTAATGKFAMQISGHTHGGQINLPLFGRLVLPLMGQKYPAGLYQVKDMLLYTNRGIGLVHVPARINCPPEITVFTFVPAG